MVSSREHTLQDDTETTSEEDPDTVADDTGSASVRNTERDTPVGADSGVASPPTDERAPDTHAPSDANDSTHGRETVTPREAYGDTQSGGTGPGVREQESAPKTAVDSHIDTGVGSTALTATEGWVQTHSREPQNDGRSPTRTYFDPNDVAGRYPGGQRHRDPSERRSWQTLAQWQDGVQSDISRGAQNWWADKKRWVDMFADQMGATEYHADRCHDILEDLDVSAYQPDRIPAELIIVGILSLLIDHDISDPDNFDSRALKRGRTEALLNDLDVDVSAYESVRSKLRQRDGDVIFGD